jgi:hypothetical protein
MKFLPFNQNFQLKFIENSKKNFNLIIAKKCKRVERAVSFHLKEFHFVRKNDDE